LQELKEITHDVLYENYRTEKLSHAGEVDPNDENIQYVLVPAGLAASALKD
jgi:septin family protein